MLDAKKTHEGYLLISLAAILWSILGISVRKLSNLGIDELSISTIRPIIAGFFYVLLSLIRNPKSFKTDFKGIIFFLFYGIVALDGMFLAYTYSIKYTSIATATVLTFINPIFVMIMSYFLFNEKFTHNKIIALILTIIGCFLISKGYNPTAFKLNFWGISMGILSGLAVALQNVLGKIGAKKYTPQTHLTYSFLFAAAFLCFFRSPFTLIEQVNTIPKLFYILIIGFITIIANGAFVKALQYVESSKASIICSIEPLIAAVLGYLIFKETLEPLQLIGMILILFSITIIQVKPRKKKIYIN